MQAGFLKNYVEGGAYYPQGGGQVLSAHLADALIANGGAVELNARVAKILVDDGRATGMYIARFRNLKEQHPDFIRGYGFQGGAGCGEYPGMAHGIPGFGVSFKRAVLRKYPTPLGIIGFVEVAAAVFGYSRWSEAAIFVVLILVLVFRPAGLLGQQLGERA